MNFKRRSARRYTGCGGAGQECACGRTRGGMRGHRHPSRAEIFHEQSHREEIEHPEMPSHGRQYGDWDWDPFSQTLAEFLAGDLQPPVEAAFPDKFNLYESARFASRRPTRRELMQMEIDLANIDLGRTA